MKKLLDWLLRHEGLVVLLFLVVALRLPSLFEPYWYGDEQIYLTIGQGIRKGLVLYRDITDYPNKPPLIYLLAAVAGSVFWFRFILLLWNLVHVVVMNLLLKRLFMGKKWLVGGGTLAFVLLTSLPILEGNIANGEIFMSMPVTIGMLWLWNAKKLRRYFLAGLMFALGFLFKIPVAVEVVAAGLFFWWFKGKWVDWRLIAFGLGWGLPIILVLGLWQLQGVAARELIANAAGSAGYVSVWGGFSSLQLRLILTLILTMLLWLVRKKVRPVVVFASLWFGWALFGALLSGRPYGHYLIQPVVPLVILMALVVEVRKVWEGIVIAVGIGLGIGAFWLFGFKLGPVVKYYQNFGEWVAGKRSFGEYISAYDGRMVRNYQLAKYLKTHTEPEEKIYIWGTQPDVYVMADRLPVGQLTVSFHVKDLKAYKETVEWLEVEPAAYIVMMSNEDKFEALEGLVESKYQLVEGLDEAWVYRRM